MLGELPAAGAGEKGDGDTIEVSVVVLTWAVGGPPAGYGPAGLEQAAVA